MLQMNPDTDYDCLKSFGSLFSEDIPIRAVINRSEFYCFTYLYFSFIRRAINVSNFQGTTIKIQRTADGHLVTESEFLTIVSIYSSPLMLKSRRGNINQFIPFS